jgi:hypothetical protein
MRQANITHDHMERNNDPNVYPLLYLRHTRGISTFVLTELINEVENAPDGEYVARPVSVLSGGVQYP